jgi:phasin family protein
MSAKTKTPEAIDVDSGAAYQGSSPKTGAKDQASVFLKGSAPVAGGPPDSDAPAKVNTGNPAAVTLTTVPAAATAPDEKGLPPAAKPDDQSVARQASLAAAPVLAGNDSSPQAKPADQESVGTSPPAAAVRADHGPSLTANAGDKDAAGPEASLPAVHLPDEGDHAPDRIGLHTATMNVAELVSLGQGNFDALLKAGQIWTTGLQELATQVAATAQASFGETLAVLTALSSAKSTQDALDLQTKLVRSALEKALAASSHIGDASVKLLEQTLAPLTTRATLTAETFSKRAA